ncbi:MAG TPA: nuclease A inhibitor family protein [Gemmataceae bacterium]|nr:nuclease A inhibitor family protein [Gemmataceae bacterium]
MTKSVFDELTQATKGLLYISETDAELTPITFAAGAIDAKLVRKVAGVKASTRVEESSLDEFFRVVPAEDKAKFAKLAVVLKRLDGIKVFKVGDEPEKQLFVVGKDEEGALVGLHTIVVET